MRSPSPILIALCGVFCGCMIDVFIKMLAAHVPVLELTVWRYVFGAAIAGAAFLFARRPVPLLESWRFHAFRGLFGLGASLGFFFALTQLGLAEVTVLGFTASLMIAPIAALLLGEHMRPLAALAAMVGFAGAAFAVSAATGGAPEGGHRLLGVAAALFAAVCYTLSVVLLRFRAQREDALTIVMLANLIPALYGVPLLMVTNPVPPLLFLPALAGLGLFGVGIWWLLTLAYARAPAQRLAPVEYTGLLWSAALGYLFFSEVPSWRLWAGGVLIVAACLLVVFEHPPRKLPTKP